MCKNPQRYQAYRSRWLVFGITKGSHRQYKHSTKQGRVTIAGHPSHELAPGTLNSIFKQAQIKKTDSKR